MTATETSDDVVISMTVTYGQPRSLPKLAAKMNGLTIVTLGLTLAVVSESRGITGILVLSSLQVPGGGG